MIIKSLLVLFLIVFVFSYINGYLHKGIGIVYAAAKEKISDIHSTSHSQRSKPTFLVIGRYNKDEIKAVWLDIRRAFKPKTEHTAIITDAISKEDAVTIARNTNILNSIDTIQLDYCDKAQMSSIKEGVYWIVYDKVKNISIYVDAFTSKYAILYHETGEYDLTNY